jgi:hypothetical protein
MKLKLKLNYDRQSVGQSVLVSGTHLGSATNFSFSLKLSWDSPNLEGQVPVFISPQEQGGPDIPPGFPFRRLSTVALRVVRGEEKRTQCPEFYLGHPVPGTYKSGDLAFQVRGTQTRAGLRWQGPAATVNYRPVLSSERALQNNKPATV